MASILFYRHHFGFREKHSKQQAIISLVEKITAAWESGDIDIGVSLTLKGRLTSSSPTLLKKMYAYEIRGTAFKLLKSYLTDQLEIGIVASLVVPMVYRGAPFSTNVTHDTGLMYRSYI